MTKELPRRELLVLSSVGTDVPKGASGGSLPTPVGQGRRRLDLSSPDEGLDPGRPPGAVGPLSAIRDDDSGHLVRLPVPSLGPALPRPLAHLGPPGVRNVPAPSAGRGARDPDHRDCPGHYKCRSRARRGIAGMKREFSLVRQPIRTSRRSRRNRAGFHSSEESTPREDSETCAFDTLSFDEGGGPRRKGPAPGPTRIRSCSARWGGSAGTTPEDLLRRGRRGDGRR